jgi:predicted TPR repeat methyltransferase
LFVGRISAKKSGSRRKQPRIESLTDSLTTALQLHRSGKTKEAWDLYEEVVKKDPTFPDGWHFLGLLNFQTGHRDEGIAALRRCLSLNPDYADAHANLANMLVATNQIPDAEEHLARAITLAPDALPPRITLAMIHRLSGRPAEAESLLRPAVESHPKNVLLRHGLTKALLALNRTEEALVHGLQAAALEAEQGDNEGQGSHLLGYALGKLGRFDEAADHYRKRLKGAPDDVQARHLLAACGGAEMPTRAAEDYVRDTFDKFAGSFESKLARLGYRAPKLIQLAVEQCVPPPAGNLDILDAGCGTGLVGAALKPWCARLEGVDLSPGMLERARERGIYDSLVEEDLGAFLARNSLRYDLIASADTLIYFGALEEVAIHAHEALRAGGWLLLTVEDGGEQPEGYKLQFHGRYTHRADYVVRALERAGFLEVRIAREAVRTEGGSPVLGLVVAARRRPT